MKAKVINRFPFAHSGSLLVQEQLDAVMEAIARLPGSRFVFGEIQPELAERLRAAGFANIEPSGVLPVWGHK